MKKERMIKYILIFAIALLILFVVSKIVLSQKNREDTTSIPKVISSSNINEDEDEDYNVKTTEMSIESREIKDLIKKNWTTRGVDLGTQESTFEEYNIYFDEGIEVRTIMGKIFNIVFTEKYKESILENIKVNTDIQKIIEILGEPTFGSKDEDLIGYKGNDIYIFFSENEVSVYRIEKDTDKEEFSKLLEEFEQDYDIWNLGNTLTDIWQDYDRYEYGEDYASLTYTLRGLKMQFNYTGQNGITIFNNYVGNIKEDITSEELLADESLIPEYIFLKPNIDLVYEHEITRKLNSIFRYIKESEDIFTEKATNKFKAYVDYAEGGYRNLKVSSLTREYPNSEIEKDLIINSFLWFDDYRLIYSVSNKGIYLYNCRTREKATLLSGNGKYNLEGIENGILKYDGIGAKLDI